MTDTPHDVVRSRAYPHTGLGGRSVVRLVADGIAPATDAAMSFLGFGAPDLGEPSLTAPRRPLGYPGWALVHDPDNGALALQAAKELRVAAAQAIAKPKQAEATYETIAKRLPVRHLPSLYEQAARDFLDAERGHWASTYFGRARTAELTHALTPDPDELHLSYVEFAIAGAVSVKALKSYQAELQKRHTPQEAFDIFLDLTMRRTKAGVAPWAGLTVQVRDLARAAGLDVEATLADLALRLLRQPAVRRAPAGFWTAVTPILAKLVKANTEAARLVADLFPEERAWWWPFLLEFDAAAAVSDPAAWIARAHTVSTSWRQPAPPVELYTFVERLAPRVTEPLDPENWVERHSFLQADLVETCLASGVPMKVPGPQSILGLDEWRGRTGLSTLASRVEWEPLMRRSAWLYLAQNSGVKFLEHPALKPYLEQYLDEQFQHAAGGGLAAASDALDTLRRVLQGVPVDERLAARLKGVDVTAALGRTLRAGVFDELGWPALEEALADFKSVNAYSVSWPYLTIWDTTHAVVVGPEGVVARHQFREVLDDYNLLVIYSGGRFLVGHGWNPREGYWSDHPTDTFEPPYGYAYRSSPLGYSPVDEQGVRVGHHGPLHPGRRDLNELHEAAPHVLFDGQTRWVHSDGEYKVLDADGRRAPGEPPAIAVGPVPTGEIRNEWYTWLARLPEGVSGPFGEGLLGGRVSGPEVGDWYTHRGQGAATVTLHTAEGTEVRMDTRRNDTWWPHALITLPGSDERRLIAVNGDKLGLFEPGSGTPHWRVCAGEGDGKAAGLCREAAGQAMVPPVAFWHFLSPRSPETSARLRTLGDDTVARLFTGADEDLPKLVAEVLAPGHERLALGLASLIAHARNLATARDGMAKVTVAETGDLDRQAFIHALEGLMGSSWNSTEHPILPHVRWASELLTGHDAPAPTEHPWWVPTRWTQLMGRLECMAWRAAQPFTPEKHRAAILDFLEFTAGTVFADPNVTVRLSVVDMDAYDSDLGGEVIRDGGAVHVRFNRNHVLSLGGVPKAVNETRLAPAGWSTPERLRAFVALLRERGPVTWDPAVAEALAEATGLTRGAATWLLATVPPHGSWPRDPERDKAVKTAFKLSAAAFRAGRTDVSGLGEDGLLDLFTGLMPEDPAALWAEDGPRELALRLAAKYVAANGRRQSVPEETVELLSHHVNGAIGAVLPLLVAPAGVECLTVDAEDHVAMSDTRWPELSGRGASLQSAFLNIVNGARAAYALLPGGDPVRAVVAESVRLLRARLDAPGLLLDGSGNWLGEEEMTSLRQSTHAPEYVGPDGKPVPGTADTGPAVLVFADTRVSTFLRPSRMDGGTATQLALSLIRGYYNPVPTLELARSQGLTGILERLDAGLPEGAYETDPRVCAPGLVAEVTGVLGLGEDAAVAYLQLLALAEPTDRNLKAWNAWASPRLKKAHASLVDAGLLIEATRPRAGRKVFVPGPWTVLNAPHLPLETHKLGLYTDNSPRYLPDRPLPEIFAAAWRLHTEGTLPR
ncbi:hypothetical protein Afil01_56580 [Actinorhabdospora filicis]|uniref:DNA-binding protein n=1 Tax=Actinorhabdospora filicis TaxID=1785913 RepID=A0A9W6SR83_9ACTN|nr:hypothetical protein [Actinorhabdospora filicis]GLZ80851.1 hypothetical protein Afil01_56580 [Actinorhabdospora filicis]